MRIFSQIIVSTTVFTTTKPASYRTFVIKHDFLSVYLKLHRVPLHTQTADKTINRQNDIHTNK